MTDNATYSVGSTRIVKVRELDLNDFTATRLLPGFDPATLEAHPDWVTATTYDKATGRVFLSVHTWVLRHQGKMILIDTGVGNDKTRPTMKMLEHLHEPYLERLAAVGVQPEQVDYILLTHIHADHVGWNTRDESGTWIPTFPNAKIICSELEWQYGAALTAQDDEAVTAARAEADLGEPTRIPVQGVFADSMMPVEAKLELISVDGHEVLPGIRFWSIPGHSIDHAAIAVSSEGETAIFGGDVMHHPLEIHDPSLTSMFCEFPDAAVRSRRWLLDKAADTNALYFSGHFPVSSVGHIRREGDRYTWAFI